MTTTSNMHITAIIPARYGSSRLPVKPLKLISGISLIQRVYEATISTSLFDKVIIATDHEEIRQHAHSFGAQVKMTSQNHPTGTDRIEECARDIKTDLIVNVQGDEPFISKEPLQILIDSFQDKNVQVASIMNIFENIDDISNPANVKVIIDCLSNAIYFSRSIIPYNRDKIKNITYYKHFGIYAFKPEMLKIFVSLPQGTLEQIEKLEQLRFVENGYKIKMVIANYNGIGIDTEEDIIKAEKYITRK